MVAAVVKVKSEPLMTIQLLMHDFNGTLREPDFIFKTAITLVLLDQI